MPDVIVVGGGHNGLVAAAYLARAGLSVEVLERRGELGGAAVSYRAFAGVDVRLSRYSYLVSLLPAQIVRDLGLDLTLRRRRISSYTPPAGLLVDAQDDARTAASFRRVTGGDREFAAWQSFAALTANAARGVWPSLLEPLPTREELRQAVVAAAGSKREGDEAWRVLFEEPLSVGLEERFANDTVRGVVATDGLIGTFTGLDDLRANRCFLYHVIGGGTGDWDVPVGGMDAVTGALTRAAADAGAVLHTGADVSAITPDGEVRYVQGKQEHVAHARWVLSGVAPATLAQLLGEELGPPPEGAQLKVNMVLRRLPRVLGGVDPREAFAGTLHVNEGYRQLAEAYAQASAGRIPELPPCEVYCHSLTDDSIIGPDAAGLHTLTLFGLHMPARLFDGAGTNASFVPPGAPKDALVATLASLNSVLAEPIEECLHLDANGDPCVEVKTPVDLERELGMPGGHIFHGDLDWPYAGESTAGAGPWGVATPHSQILLCGAGAVRGGGVSGIGGHNAAMAVLRGVTSKNSA